MSQGHTFSAAFRTWGLLAAGGSMHHITRHILGLGQGFPGARRFRQLLSVDIHKAKDPLALLDQAGELLEGR